MGQVLGILAGLLTAFVIVFLILTFGLFIPSDVINPNIVSDFLSRVDLELKLTVVATVLYPSSLTSVNLGTYVGYGAQGSTVLMFLAWGTAGLIAGLVSRDFVQGIIAAIFAVIIGVFLTWLLVFFIRTSDPLALLSGESMFMLEVILGGAIYPAIAAFVGGLLGGGISRERR
ncbi:MAG: hypothetical protein KAQ65_04670 [Candidatus Thorarchaeota archaeon]|nr:hypothetical protein [Candidatus Thorarchaeota archaeon]